MTESDDIENAVTAAEQAGQGRRPDPAEPRLLRTALGQFATGVTLITAREADSRAPVGITVNSFASVSLDPALVLWSAARASMRHVHFSNADAFAIHVLKADQLDVAERFARNGNGFEGLDYCLNAAGIPLLDGALARFECVTEATHEGGDHTIIIGRVTRFEVAQSGHPLVFAQGRYGSFADRG